MKKSQKITAEIFEITGQKVDEDDPIVISALVNYNLLEEQEKSHKENIQHLINDFANTISKATQVKKRNRINQLILFLLVSNLIISIFTLIIFLKLTYFR